MFEKEKTVLALLGYRSGGRAALPRERRRILKVAYRSDLAKVLDLEDYETSDARSWGAPCSRERLQAIAGCLAFPIHSWRHGHHARDMSEAIRDREVDLRWFKSEFCKTEEDWPHGLDDLGQVSE